MGHLSHSPPPKAQKSLRMSGERLSKPKAMDDFKEAVVFSWTQQESCADECTVFVTVHMKPEQFQPVKIPAERGGQYKASPLSKELLSVIAPGRVESQFSLRM